MIMVSFGYLTGGLRAIITLDGNLHKREEAHGIKQLSHLLKLQ